MSRVKGAARSETAVKVIVMVLLGALFVHKTVWKVVPLSKLTEQVKVVT